MSDRYYYVYILTRERNSVFYTGITNNLIKRVYQHRTERGSEFTAKYGVKRLVYFEVYTDVWQAIHREKLIKKWKRKFKIDAIERTNPNWQDLYYDLLGVPDPAINAG